MNTSKKIISTITLSVKAIDPNSYITSENNEQPETTESQQEENTQDDEEHISVNEEKKGYKIIIEDNAKLHNEVEQIKAEYKQKEFDIEWKYKSKRKNGTIN